MKKFTFPCGCQFDILEDGNPPKIRFNPDIEEIPLDCERTWAIIAEGNTKGVFQLESQLGRSSAKKLKPENMEQLSGLIAAIRPGASEAKLDGKTVTAHYFDRKNNIEETTYYHPALEGALKNTYGLLIYQEQAMQIAKDIAGFNLQEADELRKAAGKKLPELMAKVKTKFIEGAKKQKVVTDIEAEEIFGWIEKSQRYAFNASHSYSYAYNAYLSAYCKAHFPRQFFTSYLYYSKEKPKPAIEIKELVNNAKASNIAVRTPDFRQIFAKSEVDGLVPSQHFMLRDKTIFVGFSDIKGIGEAAVHKLLELIPEVEKQVGKSHTEWTWLDFLLHCTPRMTSTVVKALIQVGSFSYMGLSRNAMVYEYDALQKLTTKEAEWLSKNTAGATLIDRLEHMIAAGVGRDFGISNKNRVEKVADIVKSLKSPPYSLEDAPDWIAGIEEALLGIPITCTKVDSRDASTANCTCQEYLQGKGSQFIIIACQLTAVRVIKTKNGKNPGQEMAFLSIEDTTGGMESVVVFPDQFNELSGLLVEGNIVLVGGEKGKDNSLIVKNVWQL